MKISPEKLAAEAQATGFRPDILEKVAHLLGLLDAMRSHPFLNGKLVLKGGTALNLFVFDVPRLSVDIDLNYVGAEDRDGMVAERHKSSRLFKHSSLGRVSPSGGCLKNTPEASGRCGMKAPPAGAGTSKWTSISCSVSRYGGDQ